MINAQCWVNHMGIWMMEPMFLRQAVASIIAGTWKPTDPNAGDIKQPDMLVIAGGKLIEDEYGNTLATVTSEGTAIISMTGPMMKGQSKYGGSSTVQTRRALRAAAADADVKNILLNIDSPGGHVAGTQQLADEVIATRALKPVHAQIDDLGASAAYWIASQTESISANRTARIGSIGVVAVVYDESQAFATEGVKVHVVSTGKFKGAFAEGAEVTPEQLKELQSEVDAINAHFLEAVSNGRAMKGSEVRALADGRMFMADDARKAGLIDKVRSTEETLQFMAERAAMAGRRRKVAAAVAAVGRNERIARAKAGQYTPQEMANALEVPLHRVKYLIASKCITAVAMAGKTKTYDLRAFNRVKMAIREKAAK